MYEDSLTSAVMPSPICLAVGGSSRLFRSQVWKSELYSVLPPPGFQNPPLVHETRILQDCREELGSDTVPMLSLDCWMETGQRLGYGVEYGVWCRRHLS